MYCLLCFKNVLPLMLNCMHFTDTKLIQKSWLEKKKEKGLKRSNKSLCKWVKTEKLPRTQPCKQKPHKFTNIEALCGTPL